MIFNRAFRVAAGLIIASGAIAAHPAVAKDAPATTTAATTQLTGAINGTVAGPLGQGDKEFTQLFASWKQLDGSTGRVGGAARPSVSVPSISPVQGFHLTSDFGNRHHPILGGVRMHEGVDLAVPNGTPIYAPADGLVEMAQRYGGYGNFIKIMHGGDMETRYGHLSAYNVTVGQYVHKGDVIGYVGSTGRATGPHLHYEVRIDGHAVNPMPYLSLGQVALAADPNGASDAD
jgi:murein DD-endopeptidase MepM/ murein hydrolase activator NlpD